MILRPVRPNLGQPRRLALLLTVLALLQAPRAALAHAHYDHSTPAIGQVLATAPGRVVIFTDSEMRKLAGANVISVTGADGGGVDDGTTVLDDADRRHFSVGLRPNLPPGRYVVSFQTLSDADGDTDRGRFAFYVGSGPTAEQKALDAALSGAAGSGGAQVAAPSPGHRGVQTAILVAAALAVALVVGAGLVVRRRHQARA